MHPSQANLYLDPLLPLAVRGNPATLPGVNQPGVSAVLVCMAGSCRPGGATPGRGAAGVSAPGLLRLTLGDTERIAWSSSHAGEFAAADSPERPRGWLIIMGRRLLDELIVGTFGDPGFSRFLDELGSPGAVPCDVLDSELDSALAGLEAELAAREPAYRVRARSLLSGVLLLLYRASLVTPELRNGDGIRLGAVLDHIEANYAEELTLAGLASMMATSPSYFSRLFRSEIGMPLFEYINRTRVRKACLLLKNPALPVTAIAFDVGYNSVSFFNRYFRRIMNMTPREYRRYLSS